MANALNLSLATHLFGKGTSSSDSASSIYQNNTSFLTRNGSGKLSLPSMAQFNSASSPAEKIRVAGNLAQSARVQTDALAQTGITSRASQIATQTKEAMDALQTAVKNVEQKTGTKGLKLCCSSINAALSTLKESMSQLGRATKRMSATDAQTISNTLVQMDKTASQIASTAGLKWSSPFASSKKQNTTATTTSNTRLVDFLA